MRNHDRRLFRGLFLINFMISLGFGISDTFFPLYCNSIGARGLMLAAALSGYALIKVLFTPFMGKLADRVGRSPLLLSSLALYLLVSCSYLVTDNLFAVVFLRLLQGACCAMFRPAMQALIAEQATTEQQGAVMGKFDVSFYAALSIGPVIGGIIMEYGSFRALFCTLILCSLAAVGLAVIAVPMQATSPAVPPVRSSLQGILRLTRQRGSLQGLLLFIFGRSCGITACAIFLPVLLSSRLELNGIQIGIVMASVTLMMTLLLRPLGKLADRLPRRLLVICGGTMVPLLYMLLTVASDFSQALGITLGIGAFSALSQPAASALLAEEGQRHGMGTSVGVFHGFLNLGFVAGPLIGSTLQGVIGINGVFMAIGLIGLVSVLGFSLITRSPDMGHAADLLHG